MTEQGITREEVQQKAIAFESLLGLIVSQALPLVESGEFQGRIGSDELSKVVDNSWYVAAHWFDLIDALAAMGLHSYTDVELNKTYSIGDGPHVKHDGRVRDIPAMIVDEKTYVFSTEQGEYQDIAFFYRFIQYVLTDLPLGIEE